MKKLQFMVVIEVWSSRNEIKGVASHVTTICDDGRNCLKQADDVKHTLQAMAPSNHVVHVYILP